MNYYPVDLQVDIMRLSYKLLSGWSSSWYNEWCEKNSPWQHAFLFLYFLTPHLKKKKNLLSYPKVEGN